RTLIHWAIIGHRHRVDVDDALAVPVDGQPARVVDLSQPRVFDTVVVHNLFERFGVVGSYNSHHAFLGFGHQNDSCRQPLIAQQYAGQFNVHTPVTAGCQLTGGTRNTGGTQILNTLDQRFGEQLEGRLDNHIFLERI